MAGIVIQRKLRPAGRKQFRVIRSDNGATVGFFNNKRAAAAFALTVP